MRSRMTHQTTRSETSTELTPAQLAEKQRVQEALETARQFMKAKLKKEAEQARRTGDVMNLRLRG